VVVKPPPSPYYFDPNTAGRSLEIIAERLLPTLPGQEKFTAWIPPLVLKLTTGSTAQSISTGQLCKNAIIQNISTNPVTIGGANVAVGAGFILNAASKAGNAGDAVTVGPQGNDDALDLSQIWFNQTGTGNTLAVLILS
jgi:hypothetical protein